MSVAAAVLIETPVYLEASASITHPEQVVRELLHELRQPLSSIEAIAYYLEMTLPAEQIQARLYMRRLQELVDHSTAILDRAATDYRPSPR